MDGTFAKRLCGFGHMNCCLRIKGNVAQNYLLLPRTQQTPDVPVMETLKHLDVPVSHGHAYSYGVSGRSRAWERAGR